MGTNAGLLHKTNADGSVSECLLINGSRVTLHFAPDSERESSAEALRYVREMLFRECADGGKLVNPKRNWDNANTGTLTIE